MGKKLHLISLGCTKNLVDSEVMLGALKEYENTQDIAEADVVIVNTCGFIEAAKQESVQTILNALESKKEGAILVASGCLSERYAKELKEEIPEIDIITGVGNYDKIDIMLQSHKKGKEICQSQKGPVRVVCRNKCLNFLPFPGRHMVKQIILVGQAPPDVRKCAEAAQEIVKNHLYSKMQRQTLLL